MNYNAPKLNINENLDKIELSEGLQYHINKNIVLTENIYRPLSKKYFELFREARNLYKKGFLLVEGDDREILETDIGEFAEYNGIKVPLDYIFDLDELRNTLSEKTDNKKQPELNKPKRGGAKKFHVFVKKPDGKIKKVSFGMAGGGLRAKINNPKARQAFSKRHNCPMKKDKTTPGYWSCRLPRYGKLLGFTTSFSGYW